MDSRKKRVLFIYEGIKAEETLLNNLVRVFFSSTATISILNCPADGNIYMLWTRLKEDEFETNVVDVLKEMSVIANERLKHFRASDFSEIYLFFDYDGHNDNIPKKYANRDILGEMLETFNNETELGKLYVSYPMIESVKDIDVLTRDYKTLYVPLNEISKYKQSFDAASAYAHYNSIDEALWLTACAASQKRASMLATFCNTCTYDYFIHSLNQERLYFYQKQHYINNGHLLCILNSVPLFLLEYFEEDFWCRVIAG